MSVRLTRRGQAVIGVCVAGFLLAGLSGARSLNAVVLPGIVALAAGYLQLSRLEPPGVSRRLPPADFVGMTHDVRLEFTDPSSESDVPDRSFVADVRETVDDGLSRPESPTRVAVGGGPVTYPVTYETRGERTIGPAKLTAVDIFGLFERKLLCRGTQRLVVYPERHRVPTWFRRELYHDEDVGPSRQRDEFDRLREYARGDALRDVHWRTTAKRNDLIVKDFAAEAEQRRVHVSGGARGGAGDDLAAAVTSVALSLLEDGIPVTVSLPNGTVECTGGAEDRRQLLELLAFTGEGAVPDADADVVIDADVTGTSIRLGHSTVSFDELKAETERAVHPEPVEERPDRSGDRDGERSDAPGIVADGGSPDRCRESGSNNRDSIAGTALENGGEGS